MIIIKELVEEFKKQFTCLGKSAGKYITFLVLIEKEVSRVDENGEEITKYILHITVYWQRKIYEIFYIIFIEVYRMEFIAFSVHRIKCEYSHDDKKYESCGIKYKYCDCFFEYMKFTLLLPKGVYLYEYMDDWEKFSEHCYLKT